MFPHQPLSSLEAAKDYAHVFYDILQCHHNYPKILHRDISQGNIMVREINGVNHGVLDDWDLATLVDKLDQGPTSQFRTGTKPYMAHEQQRPKWKGPHRYRHDLESVFYVMTLFTFLYSTPSEKVLNAIDEDYHFERWHQKDDEYLGSKKHDLIGEPDWDPPVTQFLIGFKQWLIQLHMCFFHGFQKQKMSRCPIPSQDLLQPFLTAMQPQIQQTRSFDEETLDGFIACEHMALTMHEFGGEELDTRSAEWQELLTQILKSSRVAA
ncbi:hypothetical protein F5880DRAFT_1607444 [Lentinula raphanica]|nr:hypothetical protein F5880DRAFT_1607444 [Lentinula raphanica]